MMRVCFIHLLHHSDTIALCWRRERGIFRGLMLCNNWQTGTILCLSGIDERAAAVKSLHYLKGDAAKEISRRFKAEATLNSVYIIQSREGRDRRRLASGSAMKVSVAGSILSLRLRSQAMAA